MEPPEPCPSRPPLEANLAAFFAVVLPPVSGLAALKLDRERGFVRFHAMQSAVFGTVVLAGYLALHGLALALRGFGDSGAVISLSAGAFFVTTWLAIWVVQMGAALLRHEWEIPVVGRIARRLLDRH